jgi:hypothetical protein
MKQKLLLLSGLALLSAFSLSACDSSTSTPASANSSYAGLILTNGGGPTVRTLGNALIRIETPDGKVVSEVTSDQSGKFSANLVPGNYVIEPRNVLNSDFFVPPTKHAITLAANQTVRDTLDYWNPLATN